MEDWQFGLITTAVTAGLTGIATAVSWSARRIIKAMDRNTDAMVDNTKSNAVLTTKIDSIANYVRDNTPRGLRTVPRRKSEPGDE